MNVADRLEIRFVRLADGFPIGYYKPHFMMRVLDELEPDSDGVVFLDADALVVLSWQFFEDWCRDAVALVRDFWYPYVPNGHPWRQGWSEIVRSCGFEARDLGSYHMNAFCGVRRKHRQLIERWKELTDHLGREDKTSISTFKRISRFERPYINSDQDIFAAALMASDVPFCEIGPEAYGFTGFACIMLHPLERKPWHSGAWRRMLQGRPPDLYERTFWRHLNYPIEVLPPDRRLRGYVRCQLAAAIARFYRVS